MEQSRVGSSHSPQGGSAPVRGKTMAKPSDEAAQEAAGQGGFLALMAALEQSPEADERLDLSRMTLAWWLFREQTLGCLCKCKE